MRSTWASIRFRSSLLSLFYLRSAEVAKIFIHKTHDITAVFGHKEASSESPSAFVFCAAFCFFLDGGVAVVNCLTGGLGRDLSLPRPLLRLRLQLLFLYCSCDRPIARIHILWLLLRRSSFLLGLFSLFSSSSFAESVDLGCTCVSVISLIPDQSVRSGITRGLFDFQV